METVVTKNRDCSIDIVKGIAIMAIVLGHIGVSLPEFSLFKISDITYGMWHVAVFFVLAGFFLKEEKLQKPIPFTIGKIKTLYVKTLAFYIPAVLLHNVMINVGIYSTNVDYGGKNIALYSKFDFVKKIIESVLLAGREPIVGPLWFAYVLFIALIGYSILSAIIGRFFKEDRYWIVKGIACFTLTMISCILTSKYSLTLNRLSNSISVMLLIYIGQLFNVRLKLTYQSGIAAIAALLLFMHEVIFAGSISLNNNVFNGVLHLIIGGGAATYMLLFLAKKIDDNIVGSFIAKIGECSFSIMALHLASFKLCTKILNDYFDQKISLAQLVPGIASDGLIALTYLLTGILIPVLGSIVLKKASEKMPWKKIKC